VGSESSCCCSSCARWLTRSRSMRAGRTSTILMRRCSRRQRCRQILCALLRQRSCESLGYAAAAYVVTYYPPAPLVVATTASGARLTDMSESAMELPKTHFDGLAAAASDRAAAPPGPFAPLEDPPIQVT